MSDPNDAFQKLEEKLLRAIELFKQNQNDKRVLEQEVERLKAGSKERTRRGDVVERELQALKREREDVRRRIERLIEQIDVLTKSETHG